MRGNAPPSVRLLRAAVLVALFAIMWVTVAAAQSFRRGGGRNFGRQLQYATITAPLSGRTGALMVHPGSLVRANDATPLVVINQVSPIYVNFGIPEARLDEGRERMATEVSLVLGDAPVSPGGCLPTDFTDDSMGPVTGPNDTIDTTYASSSMPTDRGHGKPTTVPPDSTLVTGTTVVDTTMVGGATATTSPGKGNGP